MGDTNFDYIVVRLPPFGLMHKPEEACQPFIAPKDAGNE